ncbi:hypothetical protein Tco_0906488 [Tanacetum coccineum]|uniref:Retrovirus-related Pol polyprotein from transposon TNT 1-94 n=1 Tax=Tanacetum coccineum TaxID=301880 RepID=A0ABQ5CHL6_9ASTR
MEDGIFFNQSKYIKEMLKKFWLEDSKPTKTPMSTKTKLTKDDKADSVDSTKYRVRRMDYFRDHVDKVIPYGMILTYLFKNLKAIMKDHPFDESYILVPRKMSSLKVKQPKRPPPKKSRNLGKSKRAQLPPSSSSKSTLSDNGDLPSTKLSPSPTIELSPLVKTCPMTKGRQGGCSRTWLGHYIGWERC